MLPGPPWRLPNRLPALPSRPPRRTEPGCRYAAHHPGLDWLLFCTGRISHLVDNIHSAVRGPLPPPVLEQLQDWFGTFDDLTGS